jgi:hypothetical protein
MPRKDKKKKIKKPKAKPLKYLPVAPKGKPCVDCGYLSSSGFSVPFGFADRLGTQRLSTQSTQPVININLGDYLAKFKEPLPKEHIPIVDHGDRGLATKKKTEVIYTTPYIPLEESINYLEPIIKPKITLPTEEITPMPRRRVRINIPEDVSVATTTETISMGQAPRFRRTDYQRYVDLLIELEGFSAERANQYAVGTPKEDYKSEIAKLKQKYNIK